MSRNSARARALVISSDECSTAAGRQQQSGRGSLRGAPSRRPARPRRAGSPRRPPWARSRSAGAGAGRAGRGPPAARVESGSAAMAMARLMAVKVLPSSGAALSTASVFQPRCFMRCSTCVRSILKLCAASPTMPGSSRPPSRSVATLTGMVRCCGRPVRCGRHRVARSASRRRRPRRSCAAPARARPSPVPVPA